MAVIIEKTLLLTIGLILVMGASVVGDRVYAQERIRIATAGGLSIVPVWVLHRQRIAEEARRD